MSDKKVDLADIVLVGPALFFEALCPPDQLAARFATSTPETARDFVVLRTLAEVQKYGMVARRWQSEQVRHSSDEVFDALALEALQVEQAAWQRRLLEALVLLINFASTNTNEYFAHFLAVESLGREVFAVADERDFFGAESEVTRRKLAALRYLVDAARANIPDPPDCWYLRPSDAYRTTSLRSQYLRAMRVARPAEKTAMGYTYKSSFGVASERLHFTVLDPQGGQRQGDHTDLAEATCGMLGVAIICRAHEVCNIEPRGINKLLMREENRDRPITEILHTRAAVGDFIVTAGPHIAEVLEVQSMHWGYERYRVRFLDSASGPGYAEDWLPAPSISVLMRSAELLEELRARIKALGEDALSFPETSLRDATRNAAAEMWRLGLRQYLSRMIDAQVVRGT